MFSLLFRLEPKLCSETDYVFSMWRIPREYSRMSPPLKTEESLPYKSNNHMGSNEENIPPCFGGMLGVCFLQYELHEHTPVAWGMLSSWNPYDLSVLRVCALHLVCRKGAILLF